MELLLEIDDEDGVRLHNFCCSDGIELELGDPEIKLIEVFSGSSTATGTGSFTSEEDVFPIASDGETVFNLSQFMRSGSALVFLNGLLQPETEYVASGTTVTFNNGTGIKAGDTVIVTYLRDI